MRSLCIVPVFNQAAELPRLIEKLKAPIPCDDVLFVDDGSTDGSTELIKNSGFKFILNKKRRGIGYALICGTRFAIEKRFDVVVHLAGNGKMLPNEMYRVLNPIKAGKADYVWGSRFLPGGNFENAPKFRKYAISMGMNHVPRVITGKKVTDVTCGYRAYKTDILMKCAKGWDQPWLYRYEFEYYVLAKVLKSRFRTLEVPISMIYPPSGKNYSKITPVISWWSMLKPWLFVGLGLAK